ncbi:MAG: lysylphosphatidylglycerol synthase transmembrane domain-containing protein [Myxococcota bacterium]|nr:lysylphosphatidylglycerol synthase transmembrane domain-containing protein [Myxococcota bacterium]
MAVEPTPGLGRRILWGVALGILTIAGLLALADVRKVAGGLEAFDWTILPAVLGLSLLGYGFRAVRWSLYMKRLDVRLSFFENTHIFVAGLVMAITPGKVGEVLKSGLLRVSHGVPVARTAPAVVAERLVDLVALILIAGLGAAHYEHGFGVLLIGVLMVLAVMLPAAWPRAGRAVISAVSRLPILSERAGSLEQAREALTTLVGVRVLLVTTALSLLAWTCEVVGTLLVIRAFDGCYAELSDAAFVFAFSTVAGAVSMLPGGLMATEGSMTALLHGVFDLASDRNAAVGITLVVRFCTLWLGVALGGLGLVTYMRRTARGAHRRGQGGQIPDGTPTGA